ncbi:MAG: NADPH-dependent 7-cyano-7-deazaguanine reductase QueF [Chitinivibrionales bacterium]|nr:NADPH-dependent 7-cyano-7-deazaguanine reductase QueF [Chitinivibrionales bacterium]
MFSHQSLSLDRAVAEKHFPALETFECPFSQQRNYQGIIRIVFPEFTCVCPKTGYPDFGTVGVYYIPDMRCLELKSWKLYLNSFRMIGTFHETVTAHLYSTLHELLHPVWLLIVGDFFPRGNVDTTVILESNGFRPDAADSLIAGHAPHCRGFDNNQNGNSHSSHRTS